MKLPATEQEWLAAEAARRALMEKYVSNAANPHPNAGKSILDLLWEELDEVMDLLMEQGAPDKDSLASELHLTSALSVARQLATEWYSTLQEWGELRGQAQGLAYAIAVLTNPYAADVPTVKKEALARWQSRQNAGE
jgi:hypothetical protein